MQNSAYRFNLKRLCRILYITPMQSSLVELVAFLRRHLGALTVEEVLDGGHLENPHHRGVAARAQGYGVHPRGAALLEQLQSRPARAPGRARWPAQPAGRP